VGSMIESQSAQCNLALSGCLYPRRMLIT
jgi:hypothetical protein